MINSICAGMYCATCQLLQLRWHSLGVSSSAPTRLQAIASEIKSATTSMTSVPKPLKFLRQHYAGLKATFEAMPADAPNRAAMADVLSVLAMNSGAEGARESLRFRLAGSSDSVGAWGHEYVRRGKPATVLKASLGAPCSTMMQRDETGRGLQQVD